MARARLLVKDFERIREQAAQDAAITVADTLRLGMSFDSMVPLDTVDLRVPNVLWRERGVRWDDLSSADKARCAMAYIDAYRDAYALEWELNGGWEAA